MPKLDLFGRELDVNKLVLVSGGFGRIDVARIYEYKDAGPDSEFMLNCVKERIDDEPEVYKSHRYPEELVLIEESFMSPKMLELAQKNLPLC